ncbi:hypothetical protein RQM59_04535 [Flavobacteriaceae bacterium S356]|uniref:DUF4129 domain-containing protein n=1 Tax=Asprobacillus argus TaxID=3076534 RepID=A0ABU3LDG1_9FLAO|nr:hypothetical protein [Flavobacteriaceae bacterium S356]
MQKVLVICLLLITTIGYCQDSLDDILADSLAVELEAQEKAVSYFSDSTYVKDLNYDERRSLPKDLDEKYSGAEFTYIDNLKKPEPPKEETKKQKKTNQKFANGFVYFMSNIFPFLLAIVVILILLRSFLDISFNFGGARKLQRNKVSKLVSEDEDIHVTDINTLLSKAVKDKDYRLATRYYYLSLLKLLSDHELINYDKDKTNSEYLFELKDTKMRSHFSYLSYIYNYVWYGEFAVDELKFSTIENKYKSFLKSIK